MTSGLGLRARGRFLIFPTLSLGGALLLGAALGVHPLLAVVLLAMAAALVLAFLTPVTHLTLLLVLTVVVPYSFQDRSIGSAGIVPSDVLLLAGLLRSGVVLLVEGADPRRRMAGWMCGLFLVGLVFQLIHGLRGGAGVSAAGAEFRHTLAYGVLLVGLPIVADKEGRRRILKGLLLVGLLLGFWGVAQWALDIPYNVAGDVGVRNGVRLTTGGRGQIQGGIYGFPVAMAVAYAVLLSGVLRSLASRVAVQAVLVLNAVALLLTFERTFWVAAAVAIAFVTLRLGGSSRLRGLVWTPVGALVGAAATAVLAPGEFVTARERLLSIGQYGSDNSLLYRLIESQHVVAKIVEHPIAGSGFADTIFWGRPYAGVPPQAYAFSHNAYLWLSWKLGIPLTVLLVVLILRAIFWRGSVEDNHLYSAARTGCQGALLALLIISVTWPALRILSITPVIGLFVAMCSVSGQSAPSDPTRHPPPRELTNPISPSAPRSAAERSAAS